MPVSRPAPSILAAALPLAAALLLLAPAAGAAQELVVVVRHAEAGDDGTADPGLSEAGERRAAALRDLLREAGITGVYASDRRRTQRTAAPLAAALGLPVQVVPALDVAGLLEQIRAEHPLGRVLVVGHSNTVPMILRRLGHAAAPEIGHDDHGDVFVVAPRPPGAPTVARLRLAPHRPAPPRP